MKRTTKEKILNSFIVIIVIALYIFVFLSIYSSFRERKRKELTSGIISKVDEVIKDYKKVEDAKESVISMPDEAEVTYNNIKYSVLGKLRIKKINIDEPILKDNTKMALDTALVKVSGPTLNSYGNVTIGGHNFMKGNYFIKIMKLTVGDVITLTDLSGRSIDYYVYEYKTTTIDDASYLMQPKQKNERILTLVTCTKGGKERYYVKAKEK